MSFRNLWSRSVLLSRDGASLARAVWQAPAARRWDVLLKQGASGTNQVASSLLRFEKEVNLLRYYGVPGYLREKRYIRGAATTTARSSSSAASGPVTSDATSKSTTDSTTTATTPPQVAKVAFMITATMRQELQERLQFSVEEIKRLTPAQASLVLDHSVMSTQVRDKLPVLQQQYEKEQAAAAKEAKRLHKEEEEKNRQQALLLEKLRVKEVPVAEETKAESPLDSKVAAPVELRAELPVDGTVETSGIRHESMPKAIEKDGGGGTTWYQVVKRKQNGSVAVVAMYLNKKDAIFGQQTHQELADKKDQQSSVTFELRTVVKA